MAAKLTINNNENCATPSKAEKVKADRRDIHEMARQMEKAVDKISRRSEQFYLHAEIKPELDIGQVAS